MTGLTVDNKESYLLVRMVVGDPADPEAEYKFTDWAEDVGAYFGIPHMSVKGHGNTGTLDEKAIEIEFKKGDDPFLELVSSGQPHPPITLFMTEVWKATGPSAGADVTQVHALGDFRCERSLRAPDKRFGLVRLTFRSWKTRMNVKLGIPCTPSCPWVLGDKSCLATVPTFNTTIIAMARKKVTTDQESVVETKPTKYFFQGVMTFGGLSIGIRDWVNDSLDFELRMEPPTSWFGALVEVRPGCEKTTTACTDKFANLIRFGGTGLKVPSYHVMLEAP